MRRVIYGGLILAVVATALPLKSEAQPRRGRRGARQTTATAQADANAPFWSARPNAAEFERALDARLAQARQALNRLLAVRGRRTVENTLAVYDEIQRHFEAAAYQSGLMENVHPDEALRQRAEALTQRANAFGTELSLNRGVYDALRQIDARRADPATRHYMARTLLSFRLAGVDKDEATRARVRQLREQLVRLEQQFSRNIREDQGAVQFTRAELEGLPEDFIARNRSDAQGRITLTVNDTDVTPVLTYARSDEARRRMYMALNRRAYPANVEVLTQILRARHDLAQLLGFRSWADYITADKMVESAQNASNFIDRVVAASRERADREYQQVLRRKQQDNPGANVINAWESSYWQEQVRRSSYNFDSQQVRPYFAYNRVRDGVLSVSSRLFGVTFRRMENAPVWHPSVEAYEMFQNGRLAGRFYLDMHPRPNKYEHAAHFTIRTGAQGTQIPESVLVCNFPGGVAGDPGLMEFREVQTFFHEFGHLLHHLFASRTRWVGANGISTEWDFVEAPSQMLEEWTWDPATLRTFARHHQTNEPIPAELVRQMRRATEFGAGLGVRRQMVFARISLSFHDRAPTQVDADQMVRSITEEYQPFPFVTDTHFQTRFGHLTGYSAIYYTYMWSLVIAKDLFSQFNERNLLDPRTAQRYRDAVLAPGGSKPAAQLVQSFLRRPFSFEAYQRWLNESAQPGARPAGVR